MVTPKTEEEIELLRENGILVSKTLSSVIMVQFLAFLVLRVSRQQYVPL